MNEQRIFSPDEAWANEKPVKQEVVTSDGRIFRMDGISWYLWEPKVAGIHGIGCWLGQHADMWLVLPDLVDLTALREKNEMLQKFIDNWKEEERTWEEEKAQLEAEKEKNKKRIKKLQKIWSQLNEQYAVKMNRAIELEAALKRILNGGICGANSWARQIAKDALS